MKRMLILVLVGTVFWSGYWVVGRSGVHGAFETWFDARRGDGWAADYSELSVRGFPNRFDTTLTNPAIADPKSGLAWSAPFLQIFALSYKPNHIIAVWPNTQTWSTPHTSYGVKSANMRASIVMGNALNLPLNRANFVAQTVEITNKNTSSMTALTGLQIAITQTPGMENSYRLALNADGVAPPKIANISDNIAALPDHFDTLRADITMAFDRPWDLRALDTARPQPTQIKLKLAEAKWGHLSLQFAGDLAVDAHGVATGRIALKAQNWREILTLAVSLGWIPASMEPHIETGLSLVSKMSGNAETLDIPLTFGGGRISLGPIPLGPAPVFRIQ